MKLSELFEKLENSSEFKNFKKKFPKAYFCASFFVFDYDSSETKKQLDYCVKEGDITTFVIDEKITSQKAETIKKEKLPEIKKEDIKIDVEEAVEKAKEEIKKMNLIPSKIIAILQIFNEKPIWNMTCLSGFSILRLHIEMNGKVSLNEKSSMLDMMKIEKGSEKHQSIGSGSESEKGSKTDYVG